MSFVDVALLIAATDRPIRFLMYQGIYDQPVVKPFAQDDEGDSDLQRTASARDDPLAANGQRRAAQRTRLSASLPKARSRAPANCFPSAADWNAS